jgi:hypothetical protein
MDARRGVLCWYRIGDAPGASLPALADLDDLLQHRGMRLNGISSRTPKCPIPTFAFNGISVSS